MLVERDEMVTATMRLAAIAEDESHPPLVRKQAAKREAELARILLYGDDESDERVIRLVPLPFRLRGYYTDAVAVLVVDLGPDVAQRFPGHVAMARFGAEAVDNRDFSTDYRLDMKDALDQVLSGLRELAEQEDDE
jgi:hypothetical protein